MSLSERLSWTLDWQSHHLTPLLAASGAEALLRRFWLEERMMGTVVERIRPDSTSRWVDVGGGQTTPLRWITGNAVVVDPLASAYESHGTLPLDRVRYVTGSGESLPIPSQSTDVVVCTNCIDHTERPREVMREIRRILRADGWIWFTCEVHPMDHPRNAGHPHAMSATDIRSLLDDFDIVTEWEVPWRGVFRFMQDISPIDTVELGFLARVKGRT